MTEGTKAELERKIGEMEALAEEIDRRVDYYEVVAGELRADLYGKGEGDA